jgi:hypothetical protein
VLKQQAMPVPAVIVPVYTMEVVRELGEGGDLQACSSNHGRGGENVYIDPRDCGCDTATESRLAMLLAAPARLHEKSGW